MSTSNMRMNLCTSAMSAVTTASLQCLRTNRRQGSPSHSNIASIFSR